MRNENDLGGPKGPYDCFKYFLERITALPSKVSQQKMRSIEAPRPEDRPHTEYLKLKGSIPTAQANAQHDVQLYAPVLSPVMQSFRSMLPQVQSDMLKDKKQLGLPAHLSWNDIWVAHLIAARESKAPTMPTGYLYYNSGVLFHGVFKYTMSKVNKDSDLGGRFISTLAHEFNNVDQHPREAAILRNGVSLGMAVFGGLLLCMCRKQLPLSMLQRVSANTSARITPFTFKKAMGYSLRTVGYGSLGLGSATLLEENVLMQTGFYPTCSLEEWRQQQARQAQYQKNMRRRLEEGDPDFTDETNIFVGVLSSEQKRDSPS